MVANSCDGTTVDDTADIGDTAPRPNLIEASKAHQPFRFVWRGGEKTEPPFFASITDISVLSTSSAVP